MVYSFLYFFVLVVVDEFYEWGVLGQTAYEQFAFVAEDVAALGLDG